VSAFFLDSSALVKRYVSEVGSKWVVSVLKPSAGNVIYISRIACVEVAAALARKRKGLLLSQVDCDAAIKRFLRHSTLRYQQLNVGSNTITRAIDVAQKHQLRGYDAVQLASALEVHEERLSVGAPGVIFVSADDELNQAVAAESLAVDNPTHHP